MKETLSDKIIDYKIDIELPPLKDYIYIEDIKEFIDDMLIKISSRIDFETEKDYHKCMNTIKELAGEKLI